MNQASENPAEERARLIAQRATLRERLEAIRNDLRQGLDRDAEERAIQLENYEVLEGIARAANEELERIEERLRALAARGAGE